MADPHALGRVLDHVVDNAIKFTSQGGVRVHIAKEPHLPGVSVVVSDTGRGIGAAEISELFEPFTQVSTGFARTHEGNGLGMTIIRGLTDAMGMTVDISSELGRGTIVSLRMLEPPGELSGSASSAKSGRAAKFSREHPAHAD
jgi:signal transduction histidine kinase